jgi:hypothetical protein
LKKIDQIKKIIALHREKVAQLFQMYGYDLPITIQTVYDTLILEGKEFSALFFGLDSNVNFTGEPEKKTSFFSKPEIAALPDSKMYVVIGIAIIVVLSVVAFLTRKK